MATFDWSGALPQTKAKITSAQLRSRFGDLKTYLNTFNPGGATLPNISTATQYEALLVNGALDGFDLTNVFRSNVALNNDDGTGAAGEFLRSDGDGTTSWILPGGLLDTVLQSGSFTASSNNKYLHRTAGAARTITLPASPADEDIIEIKDYEGSYDTFNVTVDRNGKSINGAAADITLSTRFDETKLIYNSACPFLKYYALSFNGSNERVNIPSDASISLVEGFTLSVWIKPTDTSGIQHVLTKATSGNAKQWALGMNGANVFFEYEASGNNYTLASGSSPISAGAWQHIAVTVSTGSTVNVTLYHNGSSVAIDTGVTKTSAAANDVVLGSIFTGSYGQFYEGSANNFSIWSTTMDGADITELYNGGTPGDLTSHTDAASLEMWIQPSRTDTVSDLEDYSTNTNNGSATNMDSTNIVRDNPDPTDTENVETWIVL